MKAHAESLKTEALEKAATARQRAQHLEQAAEKAKGATGAAKGPEGFPPFALKPPRNPHGTPRPSLIIRDLTLPGPDRGPMPRQSPGAVVARGHATVRAPRHSAERLVRWHFDSIAPCIPPRCPDGDGSAIDRLASPGRSLAQQHGVLDLGLERLVMGDDKQLGEARRLVGLDDGLGEPGPAVRINAICGFVENARKAMGSNIDC